MPGERLIDFVQGCILCFLCSCALSLCESFHLPLLTQHDLFLSSHRCDSDSQDCSAGGRIYLTNCDADTLSTKFTLNYVSSSAFQIKVSTSDLCLAFPGSNHDPMIADNCDSNNEGQLFYAQNGQAAWGSQFELNPMWAPNTVCGDTHHPKYGESIYVWPAEVSRAWTTNAWNFY